MSLPKAIGQGKRKWSRDVREEKKSSFTSELQDTGIITLQQHVNHSRRDTSVARPNQNLQQGIGPVKNYGLDLEALPKVHPKIGKENISIFVFIIKNFSIMKQGYNARLDESLGAKHGKKSQSFKARRDESKAMSKKIYGHAYGGDHSMAYESHGEKGSVKKHIGSLIKK